MNNLVFAQTNQATLPDPTTFTQGIYNQAMPQVTAFSTAVIGIIFVVALIKAISRG